MTIPKRRFTDRRLATGDRRRLGDRRGGVAWQGQVRYASWGEQKVQFLTRYLFVVIAFMFFNHSADFSPTWMSRWEINAYYALHAVINTINFWHAWRVPQSVKRYRFAMWLDTLAVTVGVINDPYDIPPTLIVYILVVLGNGMRYGMPFFAEGLVGSFIGALVALALRTFQLGPGLIFLTLFAGIVLVYTYILMSRIESSRQQLEVSSSTDTLTGLLNRRGLFEVAEVLFSRISHDRGRLAVMFADMDKFKNVNDRYGHAFGDQVLMEIGDILRDSVRGADVAARYGGDEFVIILSDTQIDEAEQIARRIQERVQVCAQNRGLDFSLTIGLGEAPAHGHSLDAILKCVDMALYQSKAEHGSGGVKRAPAVDSA